MIFKRFGRSPSGERQQRIEQAVNFKDGEFKNVEPTSVNPIDVSFFTILSEFFKRPKTVTPSRPLPHKTSNLITLNADVPTVVWFGHSSYFLVWKGFRILVDPVFSGNASLVKFFGKPFEGTKVYIAEDFPEIDLLLLTIVAPFIGEAYRIGEPYAQKDWWNFENKYEDER